ncbi:MULTISPECIES: histidine phosphatase family protein [Streptomyces]|uniref:Histidine phosphatase family protein n=1 Tax=Streptomyces evansiae TaxID=3075535 RepID=A0ABD5E4E0_9ACTN|nr:MULTISPECIES: histidine phosphatase family protein [unclassified Streptomyces]ASY32452.1 histidine phosphatase family protein [Streptomyces sp. CLI2509]EFL03021.1 alpha-ribazole phosphatase [Streptomyces sp. SPB78]MDT0408749.1 histidine phosphatase family protein [Streptomyces sp. DSM 41979]MDT0416097.1 histidine phosphatase family protein [Streptomyces sp. DSM 41982]MDT0420354.1 histidine phosphatase family protein [Streptomyces sp. DSM 41859]
MARPRRIVLVRHGESDGNADDSVYEREPDHALCLTAAGRAQALAAGDRLRTLFGDERVSVYVSPYRRTHETLRLFHLDPEHVRVREEPRLREQDWGNWQDRDDVRLQKAYRDAYGHFFYRFAQGESGADVYDRVGAFLESLFRSFEAPDHPPNVLLVTHGLTMRLFCMRWFHWTVAEFESLSNPDNGETRCLELGPDGRYHLDRPFEKWREPEPYGVTS